MKKKIKIISAALAAIVSAACLSACEGISDPTKPVTVVNTIGEPSQSSFSFEVPKASSGDDVSDEASSSQDSSYVLPEESKMTIKEFIVAFGGMESLQKSGDYFAGEDFSVDVYLGSDSQVIYDFVCVETLTAAAIPEAKEQVQSYSDIIAPLMSDYIHQIKTENNIQDFIMTVRFLNTDKELIYERDISDSN